MNNNINVKVVDAPCGAGKTTVTIEYVRKSTNPQIILVERLDDCSVIKEQLGDLVTRVCDVADQDGSSKFKALTKAVAQGKHIVTTHASLKFWTTDFLQDCQDMNYSLIIDESVDSCLNALNIANRDTKGFLDDGRLSTSDENGLQRVFLDRIDDEGYCLPEKYRPLEKVIKNKAVYLVEAENSLTLVETLRPDLWTYFSEIKILTYLFSGSILKHYFELFGIPHSPLSIVGDGYGDYREIDGSHFRSLIDISRQFNDFDVTRASDRSWRGGLTNAWSSCKTRGKQRLKSVENNLRNYYRSICRTNGASTYDFAWCFPQEFFSAVHSCAVGRKALAQQYWKGDRSKLSEEDQKKVTFLPMTLRGSNSWRHKRHMAYLPNTYMNVSIKFFLQSQGLKVDEDAFCLNQTIQWVFRSAIRDGKSITLWLPSQRTRHLFMKWLGYTTDELF